MSGQGGTEERDTFKEMMKEFEASFATELIPGILHNFANPLNGIMGRSRLLQRRATKNLENISEYVELNEEMLRDCKKIIDDVVLIANETDRLFNLFNDVAGKFYRLSDTTVRKINLSELIKTELAFFDFYLDFKHQVKKNILLDDGIPEVTGSPADYSIALSTLIRHAMNSMRDSEIKVLIVSTTSDATHVCVRIENTSVHSLNDDEKELIQNWDNFGKSYDETNVDRDLFNAVSLLKKYNVHFQCEEGAGFNVISARIPY
ncbi:MAG: HAMP domain-containing histidine kinase [Deltaproteobacteria bacterium]|nr:HAMP domain-containing histidine kinase [Deltaproteobacteria bacterium]